MVGCGGMWQAMGACGRVWRHVAGRQPYGIDGYMSYGWGHMVGCGGMWQAVGACGRGGGRVLRHVAGVGKCVRGSGLWHR